MSSPHTRAAISNPKLYSGTVTLPDGNSISVQDGAQCFCQGTLRERYGVFVLTTYGLECLIAPFSQPYKFFRLQTQNPTSYNNWHLEVLKLPHIRSNLADFRTALAHAASHSEIPG